MEEKDEFVVNDPASLYGSNYTYADYLKFEFDEMVELIRGKVFRMSPAPATDHQRIAGNLFYEGRKILEDHSCEIFIAPFDVILPVENKKREKSNTVVQPDLCIICDPVIIEKGGCFGAPDLIIEILSPHTSKKDLDNKYSVYEEAGVREYWTVLPGEEIIMIYCLEDGEYGRPSVFGNKDELLSGIFPELKIELKRVFPEQRD